MLLGIIRGLEALCDVIEYGPVEAVKINTSLCPEAERATKKIIRSIANDEEDARTSSSMYKAGNGTSGSQSTAHSREYESGLEESEEEMINKAVAEKGGW